MEEKPKGRRRGNEHREEKVQNHGDKGLLGFQIYLIHLYK